MAAYVVTITHVESNDSERTDIAVEAKDELNEDIPCTHAMLMGILMSALTHVQMSFADNVVSPLEEDES